MVLFWEIFYWCIPAFVFFLIPFMTFYYEADDGMLMAGTAIGGKKNNRCFEAIKWEMIVIVVFGVIFVVCFLLLGESSLPITNYRISVSAAEKFTALSAGDPGKFDTSYLADMTSTEFQNQQLAGSASNRSIQELIMPVSIPTFLSGFMAFVGWFFFAIFGGIGLSAVPLDMILAFVNRPTRMDPAEFADAQVNIRTRTNELVEVGELLAIERDANAKSGERRGLLGGMSKEAREERKNFLEFKKAFYLLETDVEDFLASSANYEGYNPLWPWLSLFGGILSSILSLAWVVHIAIYIAPPKPIHPFLNSLFLWFEGWFPLFGVLSVAIFTLYLLFCAVKGCFKFGIRFMFFTIHPMKVNKTYMSSFMFNVGLVLLCALPVVQFTVTAFPEYARYTNVVQVMGTQVQYLRFFTWFWESKLFVYALLVMIALSALYLFCKPKDKTADTKAKGLFSRLRAGRGRN